MDVTATSAAASQATRDAAKDRIGLADDFDSFLQLLTAQLKAQDPLAPMDANQFTQQLVQFSEVEQTIKTNEALSQLVSLIRGDQLSQGLGYIGAEVAAGGQTLHLGGGGTTEIDYQLDQRAAQTRIEIYDAQDRLVATRVGATAPGSHSLTWDGRGDGGATLPDGLYRFEVEARDAAGQILPVTTGIRGIVDGVEVDGERVLLSVGGVLLPSDQITAIRRPQLAG